jgi:hypothetical protein
MKVTFFCDSGANIKSCRSAALDTVKDLGLDEGEWESYSEDQKYECAEQWAADKMSIWYEEE